jgi:hypothetical protein
VVEKIIEYMRIYGITVDTELHNGKAHNFFASPHILLGYKTTDAEMDRKHSYNMHKVVEKCIDFTLFI